MKNTITLIAMLLLGLSVFAQTPCVRIVTVIPSEDHVTIKNFDTQSHDVSLWYICSLFTCDTIQDETIISGSLIIEPGDSLEFIYPGLTDNTADVGIYDGEDILDPNIMVDFMQYGASASFANEETAVEKGIWFEDDFIDDMEPYVFFGTNCEENGVNWWQSPNSVVENDLSDQIRLVQSAGQLVINSDLSDQATVQLFSITGAQLNYTQTSGPTNITWDMWQYSAGIYIVRVITAKGVFEKKIYVAR